MTEKQKIEQFDKIKVLLDSMDKDSQRLIVWSHLSYLIEQDGFKSLSWLLDRTGELIEKANRELLSPYQ
jgi:hypothetical protein